MNASVATQFQPGNDRWKARTSDGRKPLFADADELETACNRYVYWITNNPLVPLTTAQAMKNPLPLAARVRTMSINGLCKFIGISRRTWFNYKSDPDYLHTCKRVEQAINLHRQQSPRAALLAAFPNNS